MRVVYTVLFVLLAVVAGVTSLVWMRSGPSPEELAALDERLQAVLTAREFTGRIEEALETRLGRPVDPELAEVGRLLFFDPILSLTQDNSCSGCHGPNVSFNGSQPIEIGVGNNGVVGPERRGPHNQRRAPTLINAAFYPRLMWDSRFSSNSLDPFRNDRGFTFPAPEGSSLSDMEHLLGAQAFTPVVNRVEMAGETFEGDNDAMRAEVTRRVEGIDAYRRMFGEVFEDIAGGAPLRYEHIAWALAEFQFTLVRADAPLDAYARGELDALTPAQKRGAIAFFTGDGCGECHIVRSFGNEMFSDFEPHVLAVPQVVPTVTNMTFDGPGADEDYGLEQQTGSYEDRYKFRTSPLRNVAYQPSYMHNGAYVCLEDAIRHHLQVSEYVRGYEPSELPRTLRAPVGPYAAMLNSAQTLIADPMQLSEEVLRDVIEFVRHGLTDPDAAPEALRYLIPATVPSGLPVHDFDFDAKLGGGC